MEVWRIVWLRVWKLCHSVKRTNRAENEEVRRDAEAALLCLPCLVPYVLQGALSLNVLEGKL